MDDSLGKYRVIILIAGQGLRMGPLTYKIPKCLLEVESGKTILDIQLDALEKAGITEAYLVIGFYEWKIKELYGSSYGKMKIRYLENPFHEVTGGAHSLWLARRRFSGRHSIIMDGDHILGSAFIKKLLTSEHENCMLVDPTRKKLTNDTQIVGQQGIIKYIAWSQDGQLHKHVNAEDCVGEGIMIVKLSPSASTILASELDRYVRCASGILEIVTPLNNTFRRVPCWYEFTDDLPWGEVDYEHELEFARKEIYPRIVAEEVKKLE